MSSDPRPDFGTAGASAKREYLRRKEGREAKLRAAHPRLGWLRVKLQDQPIHEKSWATGGEGEAQLAASLEKRCASALLLHDRRVPGSRANIDHIAVAPSGVYVIDAKRYKGKIEVRGRDALFIAGRDKSKLIDGLGRQVEAVKAALSVIEYDVPVHGCLCFVNPKGQAGGSGIPLLRTLTVRDFPLFYPRRLAKRLNERGALDEDERLVIAEALCELLPPA